MTTTPEQQAVIDSDAPQILCLAGPGAGKTATLLARIARLARSGVPPDRIVVLTYTNAAAHELATRLAVLAPGVSLAFVGTLHAWLLRLLNAHGGLVGLATPLAVVDSDEEKALLQDALDEVAWKGSFKEVEAEVAKGPVPKLNGMSKAGLAAESFFQRLRADGVMTFDGILFHGERLLNVMRAKGLALPIDYLLCDENQDWSDADWRIVQVANVPNLFTCGDHDQSIFGFRGAKPENILRVAGESTVFKMELNWRCGSEICRIAQNLIEHSPARLPKRTVSATGQTGQVVIHEAGFETDDAEAHAVANDIEKRVRFDLSGVDKFEDCAVLVRTNAIADYFRGVLKAHGLPVREKAAPDLPPDWPRAKAALALLANPDNDRLAYQAVKLASGRDKADEVRRRALAEYKTINDLALHLHFPLPRVMEVLPELARMNVSRASLDRIGKVACLLPPDSPVTDLILAVGRESVQEAEGDGIDVRTLHSAKGAEFEAVWLPAWEQETIPGSRKDADVEESRRLAFVGITRAKSMVWISWAKLRAQQWGSPKPGTASQFIAECQNDQDEARG